jgi:hypothetical protein
MDKTAPEAAKELDMTGRKLRSWLRQEYPRPAIEKNHRWVVTPEMMAAARRELV